MAHETLNFRRNNYGLQILAISKAAPLLLITKLYNNAINLLHKMQKSYIWQRKKAKIKHSTLCNGYEMGGIKKLT